MGAVNVRIREALVYFTSLLIAFPSEYAKIGCQRNSAMNRINRLCRVQNGKAKRAILGYQGQIKPQKKKALGNEMEIQ